MANKFSVRNIKRATLGTPTVTTKAHVAASGKHGGGMADKKSKFRRPKSSELLEKAKTQETIGLSMTPAAKGGAAGIISSTKLAGKELGKKTAYFTALKAFDATTKKGLAKIPSLESATSILTRVPYIGAKISKHFEEKQANTLANSVYVAGYVISVYLAQHAKSDDVADKAGNSAEKLEDLLALNGSSVLLDQVVDIMDRVIEVGKELTSPTNSVKD